MARQVWNLRTIGAVAAIGVISTLGTGALADMTVKGDQAAWAEIGAAFKKLNALSGYRMKSSEQDQTIVIKIVPSQQASHVVAQNKFGGTEMITVGSNTRFRMNVPAAPSKWQCQTASQAASPPDPTSMEGTVEVARGVDTTIDGTPVRTYIYAITRDNFTRKTTLYIETQAGLPRRAITGVDSGGVGSGGQTIDFYDYGAQITITLPPCG